MTPLGRRQFIARVGLHGLLGGGLTSAWAAPNLASAKLLVVFLRGGYDCANVLVPHSSSYYYESRRNIAIARPGSNLGAIALDAQWALHPALESSLLPLFRSGQLAFVPYAGTEDASRSHFACQDSIELGQPVQGRRDYRSGFLNRLAQALTSHQGQTVRPVAMTPDLPIALRGPLPVASLGGDVLSGKAPFDARQGQLLSQLHAAGSELSMPLEMQVQAQVLLQNPPPGQGAPALPANMTGFELAARRAARMLKGPYDIGFMNNDGWDTHENQNGTLASKLQDLGKGLAGFAQEMGEQWSQTVVVVISEFGRTFHENGTRGTDHGWGSVHWLLGGGIQGGRVVGEQIQIRANTLRDQREYPVLNDYRSWIGGVIMRMYGLDAQAMQRVFPGIASFNDLGLV